jgi:hypothetical protein
MAVGVALVPVLLAPPFLPWATPGILGVSDSIRTLSPWLLAAGLLVTVVTFMLSSSPGRSGAIAKLAVEGIGGASSWHHRWFSASVLTIALVGGVNASLAAVEEAITEGPSSTVTDEILETLGLAGRDVVVVAEHESLSFMDTSAVTVAEVDALSSACEKDEASFSVPFLLDLPYVDSATANHSGLRIRTEGAPGSEALIVSPSVAGRGDVVLLNGEQAAVTAVGSVGLDFINRTTIIQQTGDFEWPVWGVMVSDPGESFAGCVTQISGLAAIPLAQLTENNRVFWERNGTPILLVLTLSLMLITGLLAMKDRSAQLERYREPLTALRLATNGDVQPLYMVVALGALVDVFRSLVILLPVTVVLNAMFNVATFGLRTETGLSLSIAYTLASIPTVLGAVLALRRQFRRPISSVLRSGS